MTTQLRLRALLPALAVAAAALTAACSGSSSTPTQPPARPSSTSPHTAIAAPVTGSHTPTGPARDYVPAERAGTVRITAIPAARRAKLKANSDSAVITLLAETPQAPSASDGDSALMKAGKVYHLHFQVDVTDVPWAIELTATKGAIAGLQQPFLTKPWHRYLITGAFTPLAGHGTYGIRLLQPDTGKTGDLATTKFIAH